MELRHLRYFVAVAEAENVSRAALKLHVSQPALSRQVRDLEDELGFQLLERSAKSVRLTDAGRVLLVEARAVLQRAEQAVKAARAVATGGGEELHVGFAPSLTVRILPPTLKAFQSELPRVRVRLNDLSNEEMLDRLRDGSVQIAFLARPERAMLRGLQFEELIRESPHLAVSPGHPFARRRTVKLAELAREPLIAYSRKEYPEYHRLLVELLAPLKQKPRVAEEHDGIVSLIAGVEAGGGVAVVSESVACLAGSRVKLIPIAPLSKLLVIGAAWRKGGLVSNADRFLTLAREAASKCHAARLARS